MRRQQEIHYRGSLPCVSDEVEIEHLEIGHFFRRAEPLEQSRYFVVCHFVCPSRGPC